MPCAITEPDNYPDYIKSLLKAIAAGNNTDLKTCACSLRTPVDNEGCPIIGEDGKIGAFPFCITESDGNTGNNTLFPIGFTLKELMTIYWGTAGKMTAKGNYGESNAPFSNSFPLMFSNDDNSIPPKLFNDLPADLKKEYEFSFLCNGFNKYLQPALYFLGSYKGPSVEIPPNARGVRNFFNCPDYPSCGQLRSWRYIGMSTSIYFLTVKYDNAANLFFPQVGANVYFANGADGYCEGVHAAAGTFNSSSSSAGGTLTINGKSCNLYSNTNCGGVISPGGISGNINVTISNPLSTITNS